MHTILKLQGRRVSGRALLAVTLTASSFTLPALAQSAKSENHCVAERDAATEVKTFHLSSVAQQNDANEILVALRNILCPSVKIFLVASQNAIVLEAPSDQLALAGKLITELDRPRKAYRLNYTLTEIDGGKRVGTPQHFAVVVVAGQRTTLKQGTKVPVITGSFDPGNAAVQTQATYIDVGMNFDDTLEEIGSGVKLRSKVEQSSVAEEKPMLGAQEPVIRQTVLDGTLFLTPGKPLVLGSLDMPGSTRHLEVEVVAEPLS